MHAWEFARELLEAAQPVVLHEAEQTWDATPLMTHLDAECQRFWRSNVPGSGAPECLMAGALQSLESKGYVLAPHMHLLQEGLDALDRADMESLHQVHMQLKAIMRAAVPDKSHPSQQTVRFGSWADFDSVTTWPGDAAVNVATVEFHEQIKAGWLGQLVGAAAGTALEGYTMDSLQARFGTIRDYVRPPNTFNDDITFEIAFLEAFAAAGARISSADIAGKWIALIPFAWSAEAVALDNLRRGILPPQSGSRDNPFDEWIGAQMRGAICGMVAPGRAREAARLAWIDAEVSHCGNGILGEVFNAVLVARAFSEGDMRKLAVETASLFPGSTEYGASLQFALQACREGRDWRAAWRQCDQRFAEYNWIHVYPNAAAQIVALWFGQGDFDLTLQIVCGIGHDVDCNAAQILCAVATATGPGAIDLRWTEPLGDEVVTYMRRPKRLAIAALVDTTVDAARKWAL
jgi:ADP-ribosylglycohydrolase